MTKVARYLSSSYFPPSSENVILAKLKSQRQGRIFFFFKEPIDLLEKGGDVDKNRSCSSEKNTFCYSSKETEVLVLP